MPSHSAQLANAAEAALASEPRREILRIVEENPGITLGELKRRFPRSWGTVYHHLTRLQQAGLVRVLVAGRRRLLVAASMQADEAELNARALLRGSTVERVARIVAENPECRVAEIAERVGESPRVVYYHVKQLLDANLLESSSRTRHFGLRAAPLLLVLLGVPASDLGRGSDPV